jgi:hypothetical protein
MSTAIQATALPVEKAVKYLKIYNAETEWESAIATLWGQLSSRMPQDEASAMMRKILSCTILLPKYDKTSLTDPPTNLLYRCSKFHQFNERDWWLLMQEVMEKDEQIIQWRSQAQALGIIDPIDYVPITRQAFNWLYTSADEAGALTDENKNRVRDSFKRLVYTYGGVVICSIYQKHPDTIKKMVLNWRTNYFFERTIFHVYGIDQVIKIKSQELKKTNPTLVKKIKLG